MVWLRMTRIWLYLAHISTTPKAYWICQLHASISYTGQSSQLTMRGWNGALALFDTKDVLLRFKWNPILLPFHILLITFNRTSLICRDHFHFSPVLFCRFPGGPNSVYDSQLPALPTTEDRALPPSPAGKRGPATAALARWAQVRHWVSWTSVGN